MGINKNKKRGVSLCLLYSYEVLVNPYTRINNQYAHAEYDNLRTWTKGLIISCRHSLSILFRVFEKYQIP